MSKNGLELFFDMDKLKDIPVRSYLVWDELSTLTSEQWKYLLERSRMITQADLDNWFVYHSPTPDQIPKYQAIREAGKKLAEAILENTPPSADQSAAIRHVRESVMTANAAIACESS